MQGDDTDQVLTRDLSDGFNDAVVKSLSDGNSPEKALTYGLEQLTRKTKEYKERCERNDKKVESAWQKAQNIGRYSGYIFAGAFFLIIIVILIRIIARIRKSEGDPRSGDNPFDE